MILRIMVQVETKLADFQDQWAFPNHQSHLSKINFLNCSQARFSSVYPNNQN